MAYDQNGVCWHHRNKRSDRCGIKHSDDILFLYGRCRSGRKWFWAVRSSYRLEKEAHGWEDTEQGALDAARAAVKEFVQGHRTGAFFDAGTASYKLKEINAERRAARPSSSSTHSKPTEYLFSYHAYVSDQDSRVTRYFYRFQIVKKTAKRIYYLDTAEEIDELTGELVDRGYPLIPDLKYVQHGFVDRQKLEADGEVRNRGRHWSSDDYHLYASLQTVRERHSLCDAAREDISALKAAMAAAHPDRGGSNEAFIEARRRYVDARRRVRSAA